VPPADVEEALIRAAIADAEVKSLVLQQKISWSDCSLYSDQSWMGNSDETQNRASKPIYSAAPNCAPTSQTSSDGYSIMGFYSTKQAQDIDKPWRESALSLSLLWNHLPLNRSHSNARIQLACLSELTRRSGEASFDFEIIALNYGWSSGAHTPLWTS
jgi:hypothetical protein